MRKTSRDLAAIVAAERKAVPGFKPVLSAVNVGGKNMKLVGFVKVGAVSYQFAADNGKVKNFADVDGFVKAAAKVAENGDGSYSVEIVTGTALASAVPADMKKWAAQQVVRLGVSKQAQTGAIAGIDSELALMAGWEAGNAIQQAKKTEVTAQKSAVQGDVAAIEAEIVRLSAIAAG